MAAGRAGADAPGPTLQRWLVRLLRVRLWVAEHLRPGQLQVTLFWAGVIGVMGGMTAVAFRRLIDLARLLFTGSPFEMVDAFATLPWWHRLLVPALGGALAGLVLYLGFRLKTKSSTDYMEAIVLGDGHVPARLSLVKSLSSMFSISSGASIGREGAMVQLSAMLASQLGRLRHQNPLQRRLLVACGAAAGIASAYNAPIAGALFVAEVVLGSLAMETFGPLVFSSVIATLTVHAFLGGDPLFLIPPVRLYSNWEIVPHLLLGLVCGIFGAFFLRLLRWSEDRVSEWKIPALAKLTLGGLVVGLIAIRVPEVCGSGYRFVSDLFETDFTWKFVLLIFVLKLVATTVTFSSGAVGGVFTPTLFFGACLGQLFVAVGHTLYPPLLASNAYIIVGMGALLAATTAAPIMAIIMIFEMTLDYQIITPLMLACVVAHYTCRGFEKASIYAESLARKGAGEFSRQVAGLRVSDLMRRDPPMVAENARFTEVAQHFLVNRYHWLYVTDDARQLVGAISMHDIKNYLNDPELAQIVIARDLVREGFPTIGRDETLGEALQRFSHHEGERLPVTSGPDDAHLEGSISKTDLLLALAEQMKDAEPAPAPAA